MESLADKLKSLGVKTGASPKPQGEPPPARFDIAGVVAGRDFETAFGVTYVIEQDYPLENFPAHRHLFGRLNLGVLGRWAGLQETAERAPGEFVLLDTETSGLTGGTGTFAFLVGLAYRVESGFHVVQLFMRDPAQEPALLAGLAHFLAPFKTVVTFNGKSFDLPILTSRHILNGFTPPFGDFEHIDLLPLARRLWRNRLPSRALKDLEVDILGLQRTTDDVPGWMIPELYYEYLHSGDARPLGGVLYHNAQDILSLGLLFSYMADLLANPLQVAPEQGLDLIAIARLYEDLNQWEQAVALYEHGLAQKELPLPFFLDTLRRYANLYRKQERWEDAVQLWIKAAGYHQVDACIELAKHFEHRQRDYAAALAWVQIGLSYLPEVPTRLTRRELQQDMESRVQRIQKKVEKHK